MQFSVPTNWSDALLERVTPYPASELFGSMSHTITGGGRGGKILPQVTPEDAARHMGAVREKGIGFNYLVNSACMGNRESDPAFRQALFEHIRWAADAGANVVTVSNPFMLEFVKEHFPELKVKISIFAQVNTVALAMQYQALGADSITLPQVENRNFSFLKKVKKAVSCELGLLVNISCAYDCPSFGYHANTSSHDSQDWQDKEAPANTFPILKCTEKKLTEDHQLIRSRWIRPEDLSVYEELGFTSFKLAGRDASTDWIINALSAYSSRRHEGNLTEILDGFHYFPKWLERMGDVPFKTPRIDNRKLDGFLNYYLHGHCDDACHDCDYCERIAKRAVTMYGDINASFIDVIKAFSKTKVMF